MFDPRRTETVLEDLADAVTALQHLDVDDLDGRELLEAMRDLEVIRRRLDSATDALVGRCDRSGTY